jgi:hypothetical protein
MMKVLYRKICGKVTILVDDWIINGCQEIKIDDLDRVCAEYNVSQEDKEYVRSHYTGTSSTKEEMEEYTGEGDDIESYHRIAGILINHGVDLDHYSTCDSSSLRLHIAQKWPDLYAEALENDSVWAIRAHLASIGHKPELYINDSNIYVRFEVAKLGYYSLREIIRESKIQTFIDIKVCQVAFIMSFLTPRGWAWRYRRVISLLNNFWR